MTRAKDIELPEDDFKIELEPLESEKQDEIVVETAEPVKKEPEISVDDGILSNINIFNNQLLIALYIRPKVTKSGIYLTDNTVAEDIYQSKVGLLVKKGKSAFNDTTGTWFQNETFDVGDWLISRPSDGWTITINNVPCRIIDDVNIKGRTDHPDKIW